MGLVVGQVLAAPARNAGTSDNPAVVVSEPDQAMYVGADSSLVLDDRDASIVS